MVLPVPFVPEKHFVKEGLLDCYIFVYHIWGCVQIMLLHFVLAPGQKCISSCVSGVEIRCFLIIKRSEVILSYLPCSYSSPHFSLEPDSVLHPSLAPLHFINVTISHQRHHFAVTATQSWPFSFFSIFDRGSEAQCCGRGSSPMLWAEDMWPAWLKCRREYTEVEWSLMTRVIQLKRRRDGFTLMRTDESGGVTSHLSCEKLVNTGTADPLRPPPILPLLFLQTILFYLSMKEKLVATSDLFWKQCVLIRRYWCTVFSFCI